jgi:transcriptional regulator with XRE-family HTH domain
MSALGKRVGKRIVEIRKKRDMSAEKLAYENDISKGYLSDIEAGKRLPSLKMLERIAKALSVDIKDFF